MMKKHVLANLAFNRPGKLILLSLGLLIIVGWTLVAQ